MRDKIIVQRVPKFYEVYEYTHDDFLDDDFEQIDPIFHRDGLYYNRTQNYEWLEYNGQAYTERKDPERLRNHYKHEIALYLRSLYPLRDCEWELLQRFVRLKMIRRTCIPYLWKLYSLESLLRELRKIHYEVRLHGHKFSKMESV